MACLFVQLLLLLLRGAQVNCSELVGPGHAHSSRPSVRSPVHPFTRPFTRSPVHPSVRPSTRPSVRSPVRPSVHPSVCSFLAGLFRLSRPFSVEVRHGPRSLVLAGSYVSCV